MDMDGWIPAALCSLRPFKRHRLVLDGPRVGTSRGSHRDTALAKVAGSIGPTPPL